MERAELSQVLRPWLSQVTRSKEQGPRLISETDAPKFMAAFAAAVAGESDVFLCDPNWGQVERADLSALLLEGAKTSALGAMRSTSEPAGSKTGWVMIPTGGTGGQVKFARHDQDTIAAAVTGFTQHFGLSRVNAIGVLPLHHVSGLMGWMRCALTGGEYQHCDWKAIESGVLPELSTRPDGWVISLVPTQLERLLRNKVSSDWLAKFRIVFLGGAPAAADLLDRAAAALIPLAPSYGMTETAAMITALQPEEFLAGARSSGRVLPHGQIKLMKDGTLVVEGRSVFRGYYPETRTETVFQTTDYGRLDEEGHLQVVGRNDGIIITGGEKVNPAEIEAVLRDQGGLADVVVVGVPDAEWGQVVVAAYPASSRPDLARVEQLIKSQLPGHKRPKRFVPVDDWPANKLGKVNRAEVALKLAARS